jgi:PAS domain S-box-containing protein
LRKDHRAAVPTGRLRVVLENQGLLGISFFEGTAFFILLVLFFLFRRDHHSNYYYLWLAGWSCLTLSSFCEVSLLLHGVPGLRVAGILTQVAALLLFLVSVMNSTTGAERRGWSVLPLAGVALLVVYYFERSGPVNFGALRWETGWLESAICIWAGWLLRRAPVSRGGHGIRLLSGAFLACGLHSMDRHLWPEHPFYLLRIAFDHFLYVTLGIAMVVVVLEQSRSRNDELNEKMHRLTLLTAASTQTLSVQEVLDRVLVHLVESLGATHGLARLLEGEGDAAQLVVRASVGFTPEFLAQNGRLPASEPWAREALKEECQFVRLDDEVDPATRKKMAASGLNELVTLALRAKEGPLGMISVGSSRSVRFQQDEINYVVNIANLLGLTLQNVRLFEQVANAQHQWAYTFDSIGDPLLVHDQQGRILRVNLRLSHLLGRERTALTGRSVAELLPRKDLGYKLCPYCEGFAGEGDDPDPWFPGYFLASNSAFTDHSGQTLGTVHVLKDITERKRAEEKYRTLVSSVQEGVFISTPQGRFLDFNDAFQRIAGYESREELLRSEIPSLYANPSDRERLKKLLQEHGAVADFEFEIRRKDGELRSVTESSIAVRDAAGNVSAYQGFLLDITERKRAEQEIRRRNRELMVLNSIGQTLTESLDLGDSLHRTLRQMVELFSLDTSSLYLFEEGGTVLRRASEVGHRSEYSRHFPPATVQPELLRQIQSVHAKFLSVQGLALPAAFRDAQRKEGLESAYIVVLWSKDRVIGGLVVGSRTPREFSPADINLLIAVGSQISSAIERSLLYEESRQAYENLRRTQEQLLHSEKMAAVGQLIAGVAHELNNPLTAILGYSQLLTSSGQVGPQGLEYADKLYRQAQRTHRIVQNLLSSARQHKPERVPVSLNQVLEDTLALRDYDLRMSNIRVHMDIANDLPLTLADPHQLQQVFLNIVNNAADAILERSKEGDLWVRSGAAGESLFVEFTDSGPGVQDPSRVFDPFYTTKPVGKGTGLGLSICYGIITEHGGTIRVRNVPPRGASFTIELPRQTEPKQANPLPEEIADPRREAHVLLVEPDEAVLNAVCTILRGRNHKVQTARTTDQAASLLEKNEFDVVVADLEMPEGPAANKLVAGLLARKLQLPQHLVLMRAVVPRGATDQAGVFKGCRVLQKPFKAAELLAAVEELLAQVYAATLQR